MFFFVMLFGTDPNGRSIIAPDWASGTGVVGWNSRIQGAEKFLNFLVDNWGRVWYHTWRTFRRVEL